MEDMEKYARGNRLTDSDPQPSTEPTKPKVKQITTAHTVVRRTGTWSRVRNAFIMEDASTVGSLLITDVVIPKLKDLFFDVITEGAHRSLYSDSARRGNRSSGGGSRREVYKRPYSRSNDREEREEKRDRPALDRRERATHDFSNLTFRTAGEAEEVADLLADQIAEFGVATVQDFYSAIGHTGDFTDDAHGWTNLRGVRVRKTRDGYILDLPRTEQLN